MAHASSERDNSSTKRSPEHSSSQTFKGIVSKLPTREGWSQPLVLYKDYWFRPQFLENILLAQETFKPRSDDIILVTQPKCGTTWLKALSFTIINRSHYSFSDHPLLTCNPQHLVPFIEIHSKGIGHKNLESIPSPRLVGTHIPFSFIPIDTKTQSCRIVYLCREPKDAFVSRWYFENMLIEDGNLELHDAFNMFCEGFSPYGPFWNHCLEYWNASMETPEKVMFLKYEDIMSDPVKVVTKLADFIGVPFTKEEKSCCIPEEVVKLCSFESLSSLKVNQVGGGVTDRNSFGANTSIFFRKGKVGDWVNHLSEEMGSMLDYIVQEKLRGSGLTF